MNKFKTFIRLSKNVVRNLVKYLKLSWKDFTDGDIEEKFMSVCFWVLLLCLLGMLVTLGVFVPTMLTFCIPFVWGMFLISPLSMDVY